jgi:hypothetical protein
MEICTSKAFAMGLCTYLWQAHLSIDRSLGHLDQSKNQNLELGNYYSERERISPSVVAKHLSAVVNARNNPLTNVPRFSKKLLPLRLWDWFVVRKVTMDSNDLAIIRDELHALESYLSGGLVERKKIIDLRMKIVDGAAFLKARIFSTTFRRKLEKVEHFNQNQIHQTMQASQICGKPDWLQE